MENKDRKMYLCLNCNEEASSLFRHTEGKFIKLMECKRCKDVLDHYVECERSIIITDLIMQELQAYKHILYNSHDFSPQFYLKVGVCLLLSEAYVQWTKHMSAIGGGDSISLRNNEYFYYVICLSILIELVSFTCVLYILQPEKSARRPKMLVKAVILGQMGRALNIPSIIFRRGHSGLALEGVTRALVFVSSVQSIRALTLKDPFTTGVDVTAAFALSFLISKVFTGLVL